MKQRDQVLQNEMKNTPILVINLMPDGSLAKRVYDFVRKKYQLTPMDFYNLPIKKDGNIEDVLNSDLKYLNVTFLYLTDNINRVQFDNNWNMYRFSKKDMIVDKNLKMYSCY